jgi:(1->4)-alpha-D-glucan 1-alpha-D-glucosylmutase
MEKAALESGSNTNWIQRNQDYEKALQDFISESLRDPQFTADLEAFTSTLATAAAINSLAQTLVKLLAPGVPDIYQGCELWDRSLVDPDNRRPVDFTLRPSLLEETKSLSPEKIWERRAEGLPKLWLIQKTLYCRKSCPDFDAWDYQPLFANPPRNDHVFAFIRGAKAIVVVPRFLLRLNGMWDQTSINLPAGRWHAEFSGELFQDEVMLETLFRRFPVALLVQKDNL